MILVTGGLAQGKLDWTLRHSGYTAADCSDRLEAAAPILTKLERLVQETLERGEDPGPLLPALLEKEYVLCREVGCGLVPAVPEDRAWREAVGRICCELAPHAEAVYRVTCGLGMRLK